MADSDLDYDRVMAILEASSGSEFSGFSSDDVLSSDDDLAPDNWQHLAHGTDDSAPRCVLPAGHRLPRDFDTDTAGPLDYFQLLIPMDIYDHIARETNSYAALIQQEKGETDQMWTTTSGPEIRAFVGLNIMMGASPRHGYDDYWRDNDFVGSQGFKNTMTLNRYEKLAQYLHVNSVAAREPHDAPTYHPINKVKPLHTVTQQTLLGSFTNTPRKFPSTRQCRRDRTPIQQQHGLGYRVVHDLTRDIVGLNHHVYHDRFFTGVQLANDLLEEDIYTCGTVNSNRKDIPNQLRQKKLVIKRQIPQRGDSVSYQKGSLSMIPQPKAISDYNQYMNGVDLHDQMRKKYACGRPSKKYWKYILWFILNCARVNAYILFKESSTRVLRRKRYTHYDFVVELAESLIGNFCGRKRLCIREILVPFDVNDNQMPHVHVRMDGLRRRCKICYSKGIRKEVVKGCAVCNIHMCEQCFLDKH
ncbi:piggyBac transposable element-derived protein 4-like [Saccostrea cucullata]|uniref:piggyBac transposable element-derived protein 4-like n=1 Tax=Saccostrea cuccullata TaxID=36930 RepID=UPI002ED40543